MRTGNRSLAKQGFTLVELMVVISIIALLVGFLLPGLSVARQQAKRTLCQSNLRSTGMGLYLYQEANDDRLPPIYNRWQPNRHTYNNNLLEPWASYVAFHNEDRDPSGELIALQLAKLYANRMIDTPQIFYCPSQPNKGTRQPYAYEFYTNEDRNTWGSFFPVKSNGTLDNKIRVSYNYWLYGQRRLDRLTRNAILTDTIWHWNTIAHWKNDKPQGLNALFGDGHVQYQNHPNIFDVALWNGGPTAGPWDGPGNDKVLFEKILNLLEP